MDENPSPIGSEREGMVAQASSLRAARYIARERQKRELRHERDVMVLRIARDLGEQGMAERLGVGRPVIDKLLAGARSRLDVEAASVDGPGIAVRRLPLERERFADADDHYEALGSASPLGGRRGTVM